MGASLAKVVLSATWAHLSPPARLLFAHMAITTKDDDQTPRYFGGRDALVLALYGKLAEGDGLKTQHSYVRRLVREIKDAGGLVLINEGQIRAGHGRAEYEIRVMARGKVAIPPVPPTGDTRSTPSGDTSSIASGDTRRSAVAIPGVPPKEDRGTTKGLIEGDMTSVHHHPYVDAREGRNESESSSDQICVKCGRPETRCREYGTKPGRAHPFTPRTEPTGTDDAGDSGPRLVGRCTKPGCTRKETREGKCWNHPDEQGRLRHHASKATSERVAS